MHYLTIPMTMNHCSVNEKVTKLYQIYVYPGHILHNCEPEIMNIYCM